MGRAGGWTNGQETCIELRRWNDTSVQLLTTFFFLSFSRAPLYVSGRYAQRLDEILRRKQQLISLLRGKLTVFRQRLAEEESVATTVNMTRR